MTPDLLNKCHEMMNLIEATNLAVEKINSLIVNMNEEDNTYNLCISQYTASGAKVDLCRMKVNKELLLIIADSLKKQLNKYKALFKAM